jgi:hypothetical protein
MPSRVAFVCGQQFWLGPDRAGTTVTFWADTTAVHLLVNGVRLKTVPSRPTAAHLERLLADGGQQAGPPPIPTSDTQPATAIEVDRLVNAVGALSGRPATPGRLPLRRPTAYRPLRPGCRLQLVDNGILLRSLPNPLTQPNWPRP